MSGDVCPWCARGARHSDWRPYCSEGCEYNAVLAQARAEGEAAGREAERAAVVAYLRAHPSVAERRGGQHVGVGPNPVVARFVLREAVPDIEAGAHVGALGGAA